MSRAPTISEARDRAMAALDFARQTTRELLDGFSSTQATHQLTPGDVNVLWILGHLAVSDEWIEGMIHSFETRLPEGYKMMFGHKSKPIPDAVAYPPLEELREEFEATRRRLIDTVHSADVDSLVQPLGERGVGFATDALDAVNKTAWHEGWHAGQISCIRRAVGLPPIFSK